MKKLLQGLMLFSSFLLTFVFTQAQASYEESPEGLQSYFQDLLDEAGQRNPDYGVIFFRSLLIPDDQLWFEQVFGEDKAVRFSSDYHSLMQDLIEDEQLAEAVLEKWFEYAEAGINVLAFDDIYDDRATGGQIDVISAMQNPVTLYSLRIGSYHIWSFVYIEGNFYFAGKMYQSLEG